jgi:hypothetical protein
MRLRKGQLDQLTVARESSRRRRMMAFYRETAPEAAARYDDDALSAFIEEGERKADAHGVTGSRARLRFVGLMLVVKPDFDEDPQVKRYLRAPDFDPDTKVDMLFDLVLRHANDLAAGEG